MTTAISSADALAERLFGATLGALELFSVYLGAELGLYRALVQEGPQTADGLARAAGIAPRYAREWLEQQAVAGLLDVEDAGARPRRPDAMPTPPRDHPIPNRREHNQCPTQPPPTIAAGVLGRLRGLRGHVHRQPRLGVHPGHLTDHRLRQ
jgi:hypothetical protein